MTAATRKQIIQQELAWLVYQTKAAQANLHGRNLPPNVQRDVDAAKNALKFLEQTVRNELRNIQ